MVGTKAGAAVNSWVAAQRECARVYNEKKRAAAEGSKAPTANPPKTKVEKTREVNAAVKREKKAAEARRAAYTKALKDHDSRVKAFVEKTEEPARRDNREKLVAYARETEKAMHDEATAKALADVARRRLTTKTPDPARTAVTRRRLTTKTPDPTRK